jgi:hypothetical protein
MSQRPVKSLWHILSGRGLDASLLWKLNTIARRRGNHVQDTDYSLAAFHLKQVDEDKSMAAS